MARKKDTHSIVSQEDDTQVQHLLGQFHEIAHALHSSTDQTQAEVALADISSASEAAQMGLLKALSKEQDSDAADVLIAINQLSPIKEVRKEARRSLIRLEGSKIYPHWHPPVAHTPAIQINVTNQPRFWKGAVTQAREQGEVQLVLCWEQGPDYSEARMLSFLLDFWQDGVKDFFTETSNKRHIDSHIAEPPWRDKSGRDDLIETTDCTLAEGRRLLQEALSVNKWRGTPPPKDYRHYLPSINHLVLEASDVGEDRGRTFIDPELEPEDVVGNFAGGWSMGDYGLAYDLLTSKSEIREGLTRDEWIERRRAWANEAHPARLTLGFLREREPRQTALWLPTPGIGSSLTSRKEVEIGWSLELTETPLSGTLKEMSMGTIVYKETGRHWFWTSYTLVKEQGEWRIQSMTDEGANAQGLSIAELQKRVDEHEEHIQEIAQKERLAGAHIEDDLEEVVWRMTQTLHYDDALLVKLSLDRDAYINAYRHAISINAVERAIAYLERMAPRFVEERGSALRQLSELQALLGDLYHAHGLDERSRRFFALAEARARESLTIEDNSLGHRLLAELLIRRTESLDEAEEHLQQAKALMSNEREGAYIEADFGTLALQREQPDEALRHFQRVAEIDPHSPNIWYTLGFINRVLENYDEAETCYKRAIEAEPEDIRSYAELCAIYMTLGQKLKAREVLEQGLRTNPDSPQLLALLSRVYLESGDLRRAQRFLEEAEEIDPELELVQTVRRLVNSSKKK